MKVNKIFLLFFLLIVLILVVWLTPGRQSSLPSKEPYLLINNRQILVEIADEPGEKAQGLSGRESLAWNRGMLFIFSKPGYYLFWMKEMKFNLDFVFIRGEEVVDLVENVAFPQPGEEPQIVRAQAEFDKVLEINQGVIERMEIKIGDKVGNL